MGCVRGRGLGARATRLPGFGLLEGFSGVSLVVLGEGGVVGGCCGCGFFLVWDGLFGDVGGLVGCVQSRELGARALPSQVYPAGKLQ